MEEYTKNRVENLEPHESGVKIDNASFTWGFKIKDDQDTKSALKLQLDKLERPTLEGVNFEMKHDGLLMVAGKVGSGKTTLLYSIMEECQLASGSLKVQGRIAYVEQEPFITSGTVEENITFGLEYD